MALSKTAQKLSAVPPSTVQAPTELELLQAQLAELQAQNAMLRTQVAAPKKLYLKVSEKGKGTLSLYGLNSRFPVSLYAEQWERLIAFVPAIQQSLKDNAALLARKGDAPRVPAPDVAK